MVGNSDNLLEGNIKSANEVGSWPHLRVVVALAQLAIILLSPVMVPVKACGDTTATAEPSLLV